jgi:hypothetical protein
MCFYHFIDIPAKVKRWLVVVMVVSTLQTTDMNFGPDLAHPRRGRTIGLESQQELAQNKQPKTNLH